MNNLEDAKEQTKHIMLDFQIGDLKRCATANFLAAIGLMVATEFLGGLLTGKLGQRGWCGKGRDRKSYSQIRFEEGFKYLKGKYGTLLQQNKDGVLDIYDNVRCGLVHQYLPPQTEGIYGGKTEEPGIVEADGRLRIMPENYIRDLEAALHRLLEDLATDSDLQAKVVEALKRVPRLA